MTVASLFRRAKHPQEAGPEERLPDGRRPAGQSAAEHHSPDQDSPDQGPPDRGTGRGHDGDDPPTSPTRLPTAAELAAHGGDPTGEGGTGAAEGTSNHDVEPMQVIDDRQTLIELCMYALDRARSSGVAERIEHGLAGVGVVALRPDGERFDPSRHEAGGAVPTNDASLDGVVAETEVVGFADRDRVLRAPVVTVYTMNGRQ